MKKLITSLLAILGLATACERLGYENADVSTFASRIAEPDVVLLDVRTAEEYAEGHIQGAINIDVKKDDFVETAKSILPTDKTIAVYCRGGKRSVAASEKLVAEKYKVVNLEGGIMAWKEANMPVVTDDKTICAD